MAIVATVVVVPAAIDDAVVDRAPVTIAHDDQAILVAVIAMAVIRLAAAQHDIGDIDDDARHVVLCARRRRAAAQ